MACPYRLAFALKERARGWLSQGQPQKWHRLFKTKLLVYFISGLLIYEGAVVSLMVSVVLNF